MNRKEKTAEKPDEPLPAMVHLERHNTLMRRIREQIQVDRVESVEKERLQLAAIFKGDDELWQRREAWRISCLCFQLIRDGKGGEDFEMSSREQQNANEHFTLDVRRDGVFYFEPLAERLKARLKEDKAFQDFEQKLRWSWGEPETAAEVVDPIVENFVTGIAFSKFDQYCWPELPESEKLNLKLALELQMKERWEQFLQTFWTAPKALQQALVEHINLAPKDMSQKYESGIAEHFKDLLRKYQPAKRQTIQKEKERKAKDARRQKAVERWPEILPNCATREKALHQLLIEIGEPGYKKNYRAKGNPKLRHTYDTYLRNQKM